MSSTRSLGLHLRFYDRFESVIDKALLYKTDIFQCFFVNHQYIYTPLTQGLITHYAKLRSSCKFLIAHSSYRINLADPQIEKHPFLKKELVRAQRLCFTHLVLHPGARTGGLTKEQALDVVVRRMNALLAHQKDINFILENSGHSKKALGGDLHDLYYIRLRLDHPEKVSFCIDTAHAHVFGYTLKQNLDAWIQEVHTLFGDSLTLIHLNDTKELCGSGIDRHAMLGEGELSQVLKNCVQHPLLQSVPLILELPAGIGEQDEYRALELVRTWMKEKRMKPETIDHMEAEMI